MSQDYDMIVIGAGSGGMSAAKRAASRDARVALIEGRTFGGTCVARGCMPKKFLYYTSKRMHEIQANGPAGLESEVTSLDWSELIDHEQAIVDDLIGANRGGVEDYDGVEIIEGHASLLGRDEVKVNGRTISAETIVLAVGSEPARPPIDGAQYGMTSDEFLRNHNLPYSMALVGGGYISVEFASILNSFGVDVSIFQRPESLIPNYDSTICEALEAEFENRGINVHTNHEVKAVEKSGRSYVLRFTGEDQDAFTAERVLMATGRRPNTEDLGLETVGLETLESGAIPVNDRMETDVDSIYAVGDVNGQYPFTPVAIREGKLAADHALGADCRKIDYRMIPTAVFTRPQIGSVGLSESEARTHHGQVTTAEKQFKPFSAAVAREKQSVTIKLVYAEDDSRLVGLHVLGPSASEIVQGFALAMRKGVEMKDLKDCPGIHPTVAEEVFATKPT